MTSTSAAKELRALADLINGAVEKIERACASRSETYPLADDYITPQSEAVRMAPDVLELGNIIVAAAAQLISAVRIPAVTLTISALTHYVPSCLRIAIACNISEILREASPQGLHVSEIASRAAVEPNKLARCLRLLATNHIFREVSPDVFTNNRLSSLIDTGKVVNEILKNPDEKYGGSSGIAAIMELMTDEGLKSSGWLPETIMDKVVGVSQEPNETSFNKAHDTQLSIFPWWELPGNAYRYKRFEVGMQGIQSRTSPGAIIEGYEWKDLPEGSVVVDVGAGTGSHSLVLAKAFGHLHFVVQDRAPVIADAEKYWIAHYPEAVQSGRINLQDWVWATAHDFFTPQPIKEPAVFLLRTILHNWSDKYASKILTELRAAAGPKTMLLIVDNAIEYACEDTTTARDILGASASFPPKPLLANNGVAGVLPYLMDLQMLALANGYERTVAQFEKLLKECGWKLTRVFRVTGFEVGNSKLFAVPT
ncbi:hypothetical protein EIP86_003991 [Pleurotus ostreatoroseus]|nr:hypothetical protein EIP86_003991 [Pleurotus ostreatoroseus]